MCGRYSITTPAEALRRLFRFTGPLPNLPPRYDVAPTQDALCIAKVTCDIPNKVVSNPAITAIISTY